jgi:hypothetical protein
MGYLTNEGRGYFHEALAAHDPASFLRFAGQQLVHGGYVLEGHGPGWINAARGPRGHMTTGLNVGHRISIRTDGHRVRFDLTNLHRLWSMFETSPIDAAVGALLVGFDQARIHESLFGPSSQGYPPPPSTHVVERQVVVARCKFCRAHTPVDAPMCQHCGAGAFH